MFKVTMECAHGKVIFRNIGVEISTMAKKSLPLMLSNDTIK